MSNSSNFFNLQPQLPLSSYVNCVVSKRGIPIFGAYGIIHILLLLPLSVFILYRGFQQWRRKDRSSSSFSHVDVFTYHLVVFEMVGVLGFFLFFSSIKMGNLNLSTLAILMAFFNWFGELYFHVLTGLERYLAVVHPITYRSLKNKKGNRIRNVAIGAVWLFCAVKICVTTIQELFGILNMLLLAFSVGSFLFCSFSVLWALTRPGPGEQGGNRERVDQTKIKAFYTILAILVVLVLRFVGNIAWVVLYSLRGNMVYCEVIAAEVWLNLPSSLVLPLLFLLRHRRKDNA